MRNPGKICETDDGRFCIAYDKEQRPEFLVLEKLYVHFFSDSLCTKPILRDGKPSSGLKAAAKLKFIGFSD